MTIMTEARATDLDDDGSVLWTVTRTAEALAMSRPTLVRLIGEGHSPPVVNLTPPHYKARRLLRFVKRDVEQWIEDHKMPGPVDE